MMVVYKGWIGCRVSKFHSRGVKHGLTTTDAMQIERRNVEKIREKLICSFLSQKLGSPYRKNMIVIACDLM